MLLSRIERSQKANIPMWNYIIQGCKAQIAFCPAHDDNPAARQGEIGPQSELWYDEPAIDLQRRQ